MTELIQRIQNWYQINCNGDWEHNFGYSIATLDNPGWTIHIDLEGTSLDRLEFKQDFQNPNNEHDWYIMRTKNLLLQPQEGAEEAVGRRYESIEGFVY